jgi:leucyl aminopeptidase
MKVTVSSKSPFNSAADAILVLHTRGGLLASGKGTELEPHLLAFQQAVEKKQSKKEWFCTVSTSKGEKHLLLDSTTFCKALPGDEPLKATAARMVELCGQHSLTKLAVYLEGDEVADKSAAILEGMLLGSFQDLRFKSSEKKQKEVSVEFLVSKSEVKSVKASLNRVENICMGQNQARMLLNAPHHVLTPDAMAKEAKALAKQYGMQCTVLDEKQLLKNGYMPTYEVGRGSEYPPRMIILRYTPGKKVKGPHVALVGKGVTYDTGGLCLKPPGGMHLMNGDMGGAAAVLGAMEAIARLQLPVKVTAIIGAAHNAIDGAAYHPGSIIKAKNGKTIYIENTDAEGRLVLTDCLYRAGEEGADIIWDLATLTGSVANALGGSLAGLFTDDDELRELLVKAGEATGDNLWPLPLMPEYEASLRHNLADWNNIASVPVAGGIQAANFLCQFVPKGTRWAHLDIAGVASQKSKWRYFRPGGTGFGVRLIVKALEGIKG